MQFSWHTLFTKATPINYMIRHDFNCYINERETPKTCLTNHKGSISHHITPLVINSLGGGHTHTHTHRYCGQKQFQETSHAGFSRHAPGLKTFLGFIGTYTSSLKDYSLTYSTILRVKGMRCSITKSIVTIVI